MTLTLTHPPHRVTAALDTDARSPTPPIRVLELRSVRGTGGGPEKTILLGAARSDARAFAVTVCYIRDERDHIFGIDARASALGVDYVELRERHSFDWAVWPALRRLIRERSIDIVHAHDYKTNLLALLLHLYSGMTVMSTVHGWTGHSWRERYIYYPADKRVLVRLPYVVAVSGDIRDELLLAGADPGRMSVILNGIDPLAFRRDRACEREVRTSLGLGPDEFVVGAVGRLEPQKRFDLLLRAFAEVRSRSRRMRLLIAGDGSARQELETLHAQLGLGDACLLLGHQQDITRLHHALDLFVQSSDYEGTSNAVLEAMALETPIVATDVGGTAEILSGSSCGLLVPPGDAMALGRAIGHALDDADATARRANAARRRIEQDLSFDTRMRSVERIYRELVSRPPSAAARRPRRT